MREGRCKRPIVENEGEEKEGKGMMGKELIQTLCARSWLYANYTINICTVQCMDVHATTSPGESSSFKAFSLHSFKPNLYTQKPGKTVYRYKMIMQTSGRFPI